MRVLEPAVVWNVFSRITEIPRPSHHEESMRLYIESLCAERGLKCERDDVGNLLIRKDATPDMQNRQKVVLQGHLDMVTQTAEGYDHDFLVDPIPVKVEGGWVGTRGTTLGADNGIGVACALAVLLSEDISHGPLEVLFTIDEETGMTGVRHLQPGWLTAELMINLDAETEGHLFVGCAGGQTIDSHIVYEQFNVPEGFEAFELSIHGLRGGHSGLDIHQGRWNAIKLLGLILADLSDLMPVYLASAYGGSVENAIPRKSGAVIVVPCGRQDIVNTVVVRAPSYTDSLQALEPGLQIHCVPTAVPAAVAPRPLTVSLLRVIDACPNGALAFSSRYAGVTQTSANLGVLRLEAGVLQLRANVRSLVEQELEALSTEVASAFDELGYPVRKRSRYPGWEPNPLSGLVDIAIEAYSRLFGSEPVVRVIHGGLECGFFRQFYPRLDMIAMGATIRHAHSPDEQLEIESVGKVWRLLLEILKSVPLVSESTGRPA